MNLNRLLGEDPFLTPPPDPNEEIIKMRSVRAAAQVAREKTHSLSVKERTPDVMLLDTPPKTPRDAAQVTRKRLVLSPKKQDKDPSSPKKQRVQRRKKQTPLTTELQALTSEQLVSVVENIVQMHPELEQEIKAIIPSPDLTRMEDKLHQAERNIYKSFPNTRWGSSRDAFCFRRVKTHLEAFKKVCLDQGRVLLAAQAYEAVINYCLIAWEYVERLPNWDDYAHNKSKEQCFRTLSSQCMQAIKKATLEKEKYREYKARLQDATEASEEIHPVVLHLDKILDKLP
ncbi:tethering factor for nuclear proteasome STS1 isoform X2 [Lingula anatina]|nr:tethering factor for nuclear proteasome STS1 isoform X2 [Lingula anatina]|eukprot:XP_013383684.1 tethering factor for nuclear proteasome STS1 isoform X2 [Lingula anatina]